MHAGKACGGAAGGSGWITLNPSGRDLSLGRPTGGQLACTCGWADEELAVGKPPAQEPFQTEVGESGRGLGPLPCAEVLLFRLRGACGSGLGPHARVQVHLLQATSEQSSRSEGQ